MLRSAQSPVIASESLYAAPGPPSSKCSASMRSVPPAGTVHGCPLLPWVPNEPTTSALVPTRVAPVLSVAMAVIAIRPALVVVYASVHRPVPLL